MLQYVMVMLLLQQLLRLMLVIMSVRNSKEDSLNMAGSLEDISCEKDETTPGLPWKKVQ